MLTFDLDLHRSVLCPYVSLPAELSRIGLCIDERSHLWLYRSECSHLFSQGGDALALHFSLRVDETSRCRRALSHAHRYRRVALHLHGRTLRGTVFHHTVDSAPTTGSASRASCIPLDYFPWITPRRLQTHAGWHMVTNLLVGLTL